MGIPTSGLVLYLPLYSPGLQGNTLISKDANQHICTVTGATWGNKGRSFDGNDKIVISNLTLSTSAWSLILWVYLDPADPILNGNFKYIFDSGNYSGDGFTVFWDDRGDALPVNSVSFNMLGTVNYSACSAGSNSIPSAGWYMISALYDKDEGGTTEQQIYVNTALKKSVDFSEALSTPTGSRTVGVQVSSGLGFAGRCGEGLYYNRKITVGEISDIYNETKDIYAAAVVNAFIGETRAKIRNSQLSVDDRIGERSVANFTAVDTTGSSSFVRGQPVAIFDDDRTSPSTTSLIFNGFIDTPESVVLSPSGALLHQISCIDAHYLADKRIAAKVWQNQTSASMISELITDYLADEGITAGTIQTGDTLTRVVANYVPVSDVIDAIAGANGFVWYIDSNRQLNFMDRTTNTASFSLTASNVLTSPPPRLSKANQLYRNIQWIRGGVDTTSQTQNFTGDGTQQTFTVGFPVQTTPAITVNSASKTVGIRGVDSGKDFYWNKGDPIIYAETTPSNNAAVQVVYLGEYKTILMVRQDDAVASQSTIEGVGTGRVEYAIVNTDLDTRAEAQEFGEAAMTRWCQNAEKFQFTTRTSGLKAGQMLNVTYSPFDFASYDMLIESVNTVANDVELNHNVAAITGPMMGSWARLFKSFADVPQIIKLGQDEQIILIRIQPETLVLTETATTYTDSISSGIVGRWLNSAPIDRGSLDHVQHEVMAFAEIQVPATASTQDYTWN